MREEFENKSITEIQKELEKLERLKAYKIQKGMESGDFSQYLEASNAIEKAKAAKNPEPKSWLLTPPDQPSAHNGFKESNRYHGLSFHTLRRMGDIWIVKDIVNTRIDQISDYLNFTNDTQKEGYTIRRKPDLFGNESTGMPSRQDQKRIADIVRFLENSGNNSKWSQHDDLLSFARKIMTDSMTLDQATAEIVRNKGGELNNYIALDSAFIRQLDTDDPTLRNNYKDWVKVIDGEEFLPRFGYVHNNMIQRNKATGELMVYYPWELAYGVRNKSTNVYRYGYGTSEIETAMEVITWILWGFQYNGNFFKQGSQPKGFVNIKSGGGDNTVLEDFKQQWRTMMTGVQNSHRTAVFEGIDLEWVDLQKGNREMEYHQWVEFLLVIFCSIYRIDPSEMGFSFANQSQVFGQDGQKERLQHSKNKGLKPLLVFLQKFINRYIVSELDSEFEFVFTGIDVENEDAQVELDSKKLNAGMVSQEDMFEKYSGRKVNPDKDTILNQVYQQAKQGGGAEMNAMVDKMGQDGETENPFDEYKKSADENPFAKSALDYLEKTLN